MYFDFDDDIIKDEEIPEGKYNAALEMKKVLLDAIKMQALYSDRRLRVVDTSSMIN